MSYSDSDNIELLDYEYITDIIFRLQHMIRAIKYYYKKDQDIDTQGKEQVDNTVNILFSWLKPLTDLYKQMKEMFDNKLFKSLSPSVDSLDNLREESNRVKDRMITNIEELKTFTKVLTFEEFDVFEDMLKAYDKAITSFINEVSKPI